MLASESNKQCYGCKNILPLSSFYFYNGKASSRCKPCTRERTKEYVRNNPDYIRSWNAKNPEYYQQWRQSNREWILNYRSNPEVKAKIKSRNKRRTFTKRAERYLALYGEEFSRKYLELSTEHSIKRPPLLSTVKSLLSPEWLKQLPRSSRLRVELMNILSSKPFGSRGWKCSLCPNTSEHSRYFEIDHIYPRHKGGTNHKANKQILCPCCHKMKTLNDMGLI